MAERILACPLYSSEIALIKVTIGNFSHSHYKKVDCPVKVNGIDWVLAYSLSNTEIDTESVEFDLRLDRRNSKVPDRVMLKVTWSLTLEKIDGSLLFISRCVEFFGERGFSHNHQSLKIPGLTLMENLDDLLLNDTLTIICELQVAYDKLKPDYMNAIGCNALVEDFKNTMNDHSSFDVTLQVGESKFGAHKLMLSARSSVFEAMFEHDMVENRTSVISIKDMLPQTVENLLQYIYTGSVNNLDGKKAIDLYHAAEKYDLSLLKEDCLNTLLEDLSVDIICDVALVADLHGLQELKKAVNRFARKNSYDVYSSTSYFNLMNTNPRLAADILREEFQT